METETKIVTPNAEQITTILANHKKWLNGDKDGARANLSGANLRGANLRGANLSDAILSGAILSGANLRDAILSGAILSGAILSGANLSGANLSDANLRDAILSGANLSDAILSGAILSGANLSGANLRGANLRDAILRGANLSDAILSGAKNAELAAAMTEIVPREGEVVGWKQCRDGIIVKLRVPADALRSNASGRKCRASRVEVLGVFSRDGVPTEVGQSIRDDSTAYRVGETVTCDTWHENRWVECAGGIHFYLTKEEAVAHTQ